MAALVTCATSGGVAEVRLHRPDKLNALTIDTLEQLVATGRRLARDRDLRGVVIAGAGESFCAGLDFATVLRDPGRVGLAFMPRPWRGTNTFQEACWVWRRVPVPVVAAVHGHCYGGGLQIALSADFRTSAPDARWSVMESKWGLVPDMTGIRSLAQLVGVDTAKLLTMSGEVLSGEQAAELGLVTALGDDPVAAAHDLLAPMLTRSPDALAGAKRLFETTWHASPRRTFARERLVQARLLMARNTAIARRAALAGKGADFRPRAGIDPRG